MMLLIVRFPDRDFSAVEGDEYYEQICQAFEQIRVFIILHYKATSRDDSEFWRYCRDMIVPDELDYKMRAFRESGRVVYSERELFIEPNWISVLLGQHVIPKTTDLRVDCTPADKIKTQMARMQEVIRRAAASMPTHEETIARYCPADSTKIES